MIIIIAKIKCELILHNLECISNIFSPVMKAWTAQKTIGITNKQLVITHYEPVKYFCNFDLYTRVQLLEGKYQVQLYWYHASKDYISVRV